MTTQTLRIPTATDEAARLIDASRKAQAAVRGPYSKALAAALRDRAAHESRDDGALVFSSHSPRWEIVLS